MSNGADSTTTERARHFPGLPPRLPGESDDAYTDRLTGADGTNCVPYDHHRNRQCSIGWHSECGDRGLGLVSSWSVLNETARRCKCPCHTEAGSLRQRAHDLEAEAAEHNEFLNDLLANADDSWCTDAPAEVIAIRYVSALEAIAERHLGRLPVPGDEGIPEDGDA